MHSVNDPLGFLDFADKLFDEKKIFNNQEAVYRAVVGRLYYGIFVYVKLKLHSTRDPNISHKKLGFEINKLAEQKGLKIDLKDPFQQLGNLREDADYYRTRQVGEKELERAYTLCEILEDGLKELFG
jgi:uncharacterized protein (UPF0332 family)